MIKLIVAIGPNGLIGRDNAMPWHIKDEFKFFKETTMGHDLLMGRKTFESLPGKLPGRKHIVLTTANHFPGADVIVRGDTEVQALFDHYRHSTQILFITGGKSLYEKYYQEADELLISEVKTDATGDTFLHLDLSNWNQETLLEHPQFIVYKYTKKH